MILRAEFHRRAPLMQAGSQLTQEEGDELEYEREGAPPMRTGYKQIAAPISLSVGEIGTIPLAQFNKKIETAVDELARQAMTQTYQTLDAATREAGTATDAGGKPWTPDLFLDGLEKMEMTFNDQGKPDILLVLHPDLLKSIREKYPDFENDQDYKRRYDEMILRKKADWLARENNRKLVG
jgi:hypothetical protein